MVTTEDMCFGDCGADCNMHCTLYGRSRTVLICDKCKEETDDLWQFGRKQLCKRCLLDSFAITEGKCDECQCEDTLYDVEGNLLCEDCVTEFFDKVKEDDD